MHANSQRPKRVSVRATFPEAENWPSGEPKLAGRLVSLQDLSRWSFREGKSKYPLNGYEKGGRNIGQDDR